MHQVHAVEFDWQHHTVEFISTTTTYDSTCNVFHASGIVVVHSVHAVEFDCKLIAS